MAFSFVAANGGRNEYSAAVSRRLQINFRFSRAPRSPENGRWPSEAHFKGVRAMNLSDLYGLFNCVRAAVRSAGGKHRREEDFIRGGKRSEEPNL